MRQLVIFAGSFKASTLINLVMVMQFWLMAFTFVSDDSAEKRAIHCAESSLGRLHEKDLLHQAVSEHKNSSFAAPAK